MSQNRIAVVVGSLRKDSFNRKLATWPSPPLAPADFTFEHLRIDDLPLYNQDDDGEPGAAGQAAEERDRGGARPAVRDAGVQPLDAGRAQERDRPRVAALWAERVGRQAGGRDRRFRGCHRYRRSPSSTCATCSPTSTCPTLGQPEVFIQDKEGLFDDKGHIARRQQAVPAGLGRAATWPGSDATAAEAPRAEGRPARCGSCLWLTGWRDAPGAAIRQPVALVLVGGLGRSRRRMSARARLQRGAPWPRRPSPRPSARTKRTSVMPKKPKITFR